MKIYPDTHTAYREVLRDVYANFEFRASPRGLAIREKVDYAFRVENPSSDPIVTADSGRNEKIAAYTAKEVALYDSCSNRVEDFAKASKFWEKLANPDGTINSAYGYLIWGKKSHGNPAYAPDTVTPWEWAKQSLIKDKDSRQAILRFSLPEHAYPGVKDFTCTLSGNFLIREDRLHLSIVMRSNDVVKGLVYDLPWFCGLMDRMLSELQAIKYPDLQKGTYTHFVHSIHAYENDGETILKMIGD